VICDWFPAGRPSKRSKRTTSKRPMIASS
jgi:hypothetical protein